MCFTKRKKKLHKAGSSAVTDIAVTGDTGILCYIITLYLMKMDFMVCVFFKFQ